MSDSPEEKQDLLVDLNFVPIWARTPPASNPYSHVGAPSAPRDRRSERPGERRPRPGQRDGFDAGRRERRSRPGPGRPEPEDRRDRRFAPREPPPPIVALDIEFLPERKGVAPLARRLALSARAYSLFDVAALFLSKPEYYAVKITRIPGEDPADALLYHCAECKGLFVSEEDILTHAFAKHFDLFYVREEKDAEPPKGNFVCVARCGLSGELLGPPNYHGFNDVVLELHRTRFSHMPLDDYRRRIENRHDPEMIEQWKKKVSKQTIYRIKDSQEPVTFARLADAEAHFREHNARQFVRTGNRFVLSGPESQAIEDPAIRQLIRDAWNRETRFPLKLAVNLRLAFRHLGLHLFKTANGGTFVTSRCPGAIDPTQAVPVVREILECLAADPGCLREKMIGKIRPGAAPDSPEVAEVMNQLRWLVDKGHVIEFSDGKMAVPLTAVRHVQYARKQEHRPHRPGPARPRPPSQPGAAS